MSQSDRQDTQNRALTPLPAQLDLDGRFHDIAPQNERMRLFDPAPVQLAGQTFLDTDHEETN